MENTTLAGIGAVAILAGAIIVSAFFTPSNQPMVALGTATQTSVDTMEDSYFQQNGKYIQVLKGDVLPVYEQGTVSGKLGADLPTAYSIDVYETPKGEKGYQIQWEDVNNYYSQGYGAEAKERTWTQAKPVLVATSTP